MEIRSANLDDLDQLAELFDEYRQFYRQAADPVAAKRFLTERLNRRDSVFFVAASGTALVGFTQLYPSLSSVSMAPIFILNDLFVAAAARGQGIAPALLNAAAHYARSEGAVRLVLSTERTNTTAQAVYEKAGWRRDNSFYTYEIAL